MKRSIPLMDNMTDENTAQVAENPETTVATPENVAKPEGETTEAKAVETPKLSDEEQAKAASDAAKLLNERKQSARERIQELNAKFRSEEREKNRLQRENDDLRAKLKAPDPNQYEDNADYTAAKLEHRLTEREISKNEKRIQESEQAQLSAVAETWRTRSEEYKAEVPDFDKVVYGDLNARVSEATAAIIAEMEEGPAVAYHLGKNLAEATRIENLSDRAKAYELGKLAGKLTAPAPRKVTSAPAPVNAVSGNGGKPPKTDPENMSYAEFKAYREKGGKV